MTELYVAASYSKDRLRAKAFIARCRAAGFSITHDWTDEMPPPDGTPEVDRCWVHRVQAQDDLAGAEAAEVLVLLASDGMRGAWIEVGAALSRDVTVLVVGKISNDEHFVFLYLPHVYRVLDEDTAMAWLEMYRRDFACYAPQARDAWVVEHGKSRFAASGCPLCRCFDHAGRVSPTKAIHMDGCPIGEMEAELASLKARAARQPPDGAAR